MGNLLGNSIFITVNKHQPIMANIQFRPNKGKKITDYSKPQKIYLRYVFGRNVDFNASIGFEVLVNESEKLSDWDSKKQRVKDRTHIKDRHATNNLIQTLTDHFEIFERENRQNGIIPTYAETRRYFDSFFTQPVKNLDLFEYFDKYIKETKTKPNPHTGKLVSLQTVKSYEATKNILKKFNDKVRKIDFDRMTLDWYYDFIGFCNNQNHSYNYIGKHIKNLKTVMSNALEDGTTKNDQFKSKKFKVLKEEVDSIYLTIDELNKIWQVDLSNDERKERARDLFLIGAFTGLRVSDYNTLSKENFKDVNGTEMLVKRTQKTNQEVKIPLHPIVKAILAKNNGNPPKKLPEQYINEYIKGIAESAEIDGIEYIEQTKGGLTVEVKKYRYELVFTHTARRSFCTNAYLKGMPSIDIMQISGHKTETAFMKYIKVTKEQVAERMSIHPFFTDSHLKVV